MASYPDLSGKTVVVTGGSRGIGAETARAFAAQGARVAVIGRDESALGEVASALPAGLAVRADVTDFAQIDQARIRIEQELGPVDVLAAFAGGQGAPAPSWQLDPARWRDVIDADLTSVFLTIRAFLPGMIDRGRGAIVTMSSAAGRQPSPANIAYAAAKAGIVMLTRQLADEAGPHGVRVNCVAPSTIRTERIERLMPAETADRIAGSHPLRRLGTPHDVASAAVFLASDAAGWITGVTVDVAGGKITN
ncbi:MAG: SDR family oxidoreductase [Hamadaea sp.]|uniref:SDR family NAD(P)-dependent oxidoreductase n=1 Tax=Hamadaea sp. TaxID=2024425 RepID=UPI0018073B3E|nr:SDR family NAD(P)-dependent oxidoreductase [Hamadaea sp.]NUR69527.1 SDR family oxidoreductase [Hamadaea sp.]NUT20763.1 SDR family oxidoreductase [Hamadaea sp.]